MATDVTGGWKTRRGETPYDDLGGFRLAKKYPEPSREIVDELEEENIRVATLKYLSSRPSPKIARFDYDWFLQLHHEMYGDVWDWAGKFRTTNKNIGVDKYKLRAAMAALSRDVEAWPEIYKDPLELAMRLHHRAVQIHPFSNGNGRWSRLLSNIWLKRSGHPLTEWPGLTQESPIRDEYLQAVRAADNLDFSRLLKLYRQYTPA